MKSLTLARNRDAWFVIRGYKYQVDLTILRWLSIADTQTLVLESGEDIDIVNSALVNGADNIDRELVQVKHLDKPISLNSPACKAALANSVRHLTTNASQNLIFRFCTNSTVTTERPSAFEDRRPAIDVWEGIRKKKIKRPLLGQRLDCLAEFLRNFNKPATGVDDDTWNVFTDFTKKVSVDELHEFVGRFEWSTQQPAADEVPTKILQLLQSSGRANPETSKLLYARLFLHVMQVLSKRGQKVLNADTLESLATLPALNEADARLLKFLTSELLSHAARLEQLEAATQRHETAIANIKQKILVNRFGQIPSPNLSIAIADISTTLPPQLTTLAKRRDIVSAMRAEISTHDWFALYGSIGCGKTQLATLLGETFDSLVYVSLRNLTSDEANFLLHHLFLQLCGSNRVGSVTTSGLTSLDPGTAIFLDDVPCLLPGDRLSQRLIQIADAVRARGQLLLTLSHHSVPDDIVSALKTGRFSERRASPFVCADIQELFELCGAPQEARAPEIVESFRQSTSGNPTLLAAIARDLKSKGWRGVEKQRSQSAAVAAAGEVIQQTMFRLLRTVESAESRELLYRLSIVLGTFGTGEVTRVSAVEPRIPRPMEACQRLLGLWLEQQPDHLLAVCPLIMQFGSKELDDRVAREVAASLAELLFDKKGMSPIDFAKALNYLRQAGNGVLLGMRMLGGLDSVDELPVAWKKLVFFATVTEGLLDECPLTLCLLIRARQLALAHTLGASLGMFIDQASRLIERASSDEKWAVVAYAAQAAPIVAKENFREGIHLGKLVLSNIDDVIEYRNKLVGETLGENGNIDNEYKSSFPWFLVSEIGSADDFEHWFNWIATQPAERLQLILSSDLAKPGLKIALDRLWMIQHERPENEREFEAALRAYDAVIAFCEGKGLRLFHALAVRSKIVVFAEYLKDLPSAASLAKEFLESGSNCDEVLFLINEVLGRQYLYGKQNGPAIKCLSRACDLDVGTFAHLRCRAFIELSRAFGDDDSNRALQCAQNAVAIAKGNTRDISGLEMVSALGEAAIAAGFDGNYGIAFDFLDEAYLEISREFEETADWKMRFVILGNALGYLSSMAHSGQLPASDYTVPRRGHLISHNTVAANWYDEAAYKKFDLAPTLLVVFANAVGREDRAIFWANKGIDEARSKGVLACIYPLGEVLVPSLIEQGRIEQALDYAMESAVSLVASMVSHRTSTPDIRESQDAIELLGAKPNNDWSQAEQLYLFTGVIPSLLSCCANDGDTQEGFQFLAAHCSEMAANASNAEQFSSVSDGIDTFLANARSIDLHSRALCENRNDNPVGAVACYLLSSFAKDADLRMAIIHHAMIMHQISFTIRANSPLWNFLTQLFTVTWRQIFESQRFRFSAPSVVESDLEGLDEIEPAMRIKTLIRTILGGLSVRMPTELEIIAEWLRS